MQRSTWKMAVAAAATTMLLSFGAWAEDQEEPAGEESCQESVEQCAAECIDTDDYEVCMQACEKQRRNCAEESE